MINSRLHTLFKGVNFSPLKHLLFNFTVLNLESHQHILRYVRDGP